MAGYAVQKPRKVQQKITAQLSGWLLVGRDGLYGFLQNRAPLFVFAWQISRRWAACTRISGSFMGKRCAGSFPVGENWYRSCWYFTRFMPMCAHRSLALARAAMSIFNVWRIMGPSASSASSSHEKLGKTHAICWGVLTFNCSAELWWISKYNYWQGKQGVLMVYVCFIVGFVFFFLIHVPEKSLYHGGRMSCCQWWRGTWSGLLGCTFFGFPERSCWMLLRGASASSSCLFSLDNRGLLRKKKMLLTANCSLFPPIWSWNLLPPCRGMWSWLKLAQGWTLYRCSCPQFLRGRQCC